MVTFSPGNYRQWTQQHSSPPDTICWGSPKPAVFQCSVPCGVGQRTRDVKCVSNIGDVVDDEECNMKLRPNDIENCDMGPCAKSWFLTEWSERVSVPQAEIRVGISRVTGFP